MSGIVGIYRLNGQPVNGAELNHMLDAIPFRGPDASDTWRHGAVGMGHCMLNTTPESLQERLPLQSREGYFVLTADARIDNRLELLAALGIAESPSVTDSNLILAAYERWGEYSVEKLVGDFAFAIWDASRKALFCARDPIGIKPFYYYHCPGQLFVFASQVQPLISVHGVPCRLNEARLADYLADILDNRTITFHKDILRLPPAHAMTVTVSTLRCRRYWALDPKREYRCGSDDEYAEAFRALFMEAVRCRMRSCAPAGSSLSGGLDSSTIACSAATIAADNNSEPWRTFTAIYEATPQGDERPYINAVVEHTGVEPHFIYSDRIGPLSHYDEMFRHVDEPTDNPFSSIGWVLRSRVRDQGIRVLLDGNGGDLTVSYSFSYLTDLARVHEWTTLRREIAGLAHQFFGRSRAQLLIWRKWVIQPLLPECVFHLLRWLGGRDIRRPTIAVPLVPDFAQRISFEERLDSQHRKFRATRSAKEDHIYGFEHGIVPWAMEFADKAASAFGFEGRYPYFDKRLIEFCVALPREQRIEKGLNRVIVRRAMKSILPEKVRSRGGKGNPNPNFALALLGHERATLDAVILGREQAIAPYIDVSALRQIYRRFLAEKRVRDAYTIWTAATLELWLRATQLKP